MQMCAFTQKTHTQISHFICLRLVYQTLPPCCRSISRWREERAGFWIRLSQDASLEIADILSAVFGVNTTHCNKPGKVNTFQVQKEIAVNSYCFFLSTTLYTCYYFYAVVIMSSGDETTIQPLISTTVDQLATRLLNSLFLAKQDWASL